MNAHPTAGQPHGFLVQLRDKVVALQQTLTWAHIAYTCMVLAAKHSSYREEPLLQIVANEIQRRVLARVGSIPGEPGFGPEQIVEITERLLEFERGLSSPELLQDRILRWIASGDSSPEDWTLPLVRNILAEHRLRTGHFDGTQPWPSATSPKAEQGSILTKPWQEELDSMVGLAEIKADVRRLRDFLRVLHTRQQRGFPAGSISLHQVFHGNPGTGKTSVARILAEVYREYGFLSKGHLVETDRSGLVGTVIGATEAKTEEAIRKALGGVLFIDEAYSLATDSQQDFGQRAIDTLVKAMEDFRGQLVVIVAGYEAEMERFLGSNPGLASRFNRYLNFPDYNDNDLGEIFHRLAAKEQFSLEEGVSSRAVSALAVRRERMRERFGNARDARTLWEVSLQHQAARLCSTYNEIRIPDEELLRITVQDVPDHF